MCLSARRASGSSPAHMTSGNVERSPWQCRCQRYRGRWLRRGRAPQRWACGSTTPWWSAIPTSSHSACCRARIFARVAPAGHKTAALEVELLDDSQTMASPVATLDARVESRVYADDGFAVTSGPTTQGGRFAIPTGRVPGRARPGSTSRCEKVEVTTPHFTDRVAEAQRLVANPGRTPALAPADRTAPKHALRKSATRSTSVARPSRCCTASHTRATSSAPRTACCSSTSRTLVAVRSSSTSPTSRQVGEFYPGIDQALFEECRASSLRWSQPGGWILKTSSRAEDR